MEINANKNICIFHVFKGEKPQSSNQEKIGEHSLLAIFFLTGPIILAKGMICNNVQLFEKHLQFETL